MRQLYDDHMPKHMHGSLQTDPVSRGYEDAGICTGTMALYWCHQGSCSLQRQHERQHCSYAQPKPDLHELIVQDAVWV